MKAREAAFVAFGFFVAASAAYVAFQLVEAAFGVAFAAPISGIVFAVTAIMIDRQRI